MLECPTIHCPICTEAMDIRKRTIVNQRQGRRFKQRHPYLYCNTCDEGFRILRVNPYQQAELPFVEEEDEIPGPEVDPMDLPPNHPDYLPF